MPCVCTRILPGLIGMSLCALMLSRVICLLFWLLIFILLYCSVHVSICVVHYFIVLYSHWNVWITVNRGLVRTKGSCSSSVSAFLLNISKISAHVSINVSINFGIPLRLRSLSSCSNRSLDQQKIVFALCKTLPCCHHYCRRGSRCYGHVRVTLGSQQRSLYEMRSVTDETWRHCHFRRSVTPALIEWKIRHGG